MKVIFLKYFLIYSLFLSNLTYFPAAFSPCKTKVGEYEENNNKKNTKEILL